MLGITVTLAEKQAVRMAAAESGMTMSSFLRTLVLTHDSVKRYLFFATVDQSLEAKLIDHSEGAQV